MLTVLTDANEFKVAFENAQKTNASLAPAASEKPAEDDKKEEGPAEEKKEEAPAEEKKEEAAAEEKKEEEASEDKKEE